MHLSSLQEVLLTPITEVLVLIIGGVLSWLLMKRRGLLPEQQQAIVTLEATVRAFEARLALTERELVRVTTELKVAELKVVELTRALNEAQQALGRAATRFLSHSESKDSGLGNP